MTEATQVDFQESGDGPVVVFVPGSFSTPAAWRPIMKLLPGYRMISTALCGYGETAETRSAADHDISHEVRVIEEAVARAGGGPTHLVGHSFGGTVAFAAALAGNIDVASIATFEANPLGLMRHSRTPDLFEDTRAMSGSYEAAYEAGEVDAPKRIIDFWGSDGSFDALPGIAQDYCRQTAYANVLDWHSAFGFDTVPQDYAALDVPVLLVRGALANPVIVAITDVLTGAIGNVRPEIIDGAGHFLISSHPADCAAHLAAFLADANG
jgi:pimeloyl-ACP methyl ester carboxylesterase